MNAALPRRLFLTACFVLGACTLVRVAQFQRSQYPLAPLQNQALRSDVAPARPVSPLFNPDHAAELLEGAARDKWQQPQKVVEALRLQPGESAADIGAGSGYLMPYLSRGVGARGSVYEEEIQAAFLPALNQKARSCPNVHVVLGRADDPGLPRNSIDCFVLLTVYHEVEHPTAFLRALHRYARPNARLAIIDFDAAIIGNPPAPEGHWVRQQDVIAEAKAAGWELAEQRDFLRSASQFYLVFRPTKRSE